MLHVTKLLFRVTESATKPAADGVLEDSLERSGESAESFVHVSMSDVADMPVQDVVDVANKSPEPKEVAEKKGFFGSSQKSKKDKGIEKEQAKKEKEQSKKEKLEKCKEVKFGDVVVQQTVPKEVQLQLLASAIDGEVQ